MVIVLMGPSGSGKTSVGEALARALGWPFIDGDHLHPPANRAKLARAEPLGDADRAPWLAAVRTVIAQHLDGGAVVACSALKESYRRVLRIDERVKLVQLDVPAGVLASRLAERTGHFAAPEILADQLATLEPPTDALVVDGTRPVDEIVRSVVARLRA